MALLQRRPRVELPEHLAFIRTLPCIVRGVWGVHAAHVSYPEPLLAKYAKGISSKVDDYWTVPLCEEEHRKQHSGNERKYWEGVGIDPLLYALRLYSVSGDYQSGCQIVTAARNR